MLFALSRRDVRAQLPDLGRAAWHWKIYVSIGAFTTYIILIIVVASGRSWWDTSLATDTIIWFVVTGLVLYFNSMRAADPGFISTTIRAAVGVTAVIEFFFNDLFLFPFLGELAFVPAMFLLLSLLAVAEGKPEYLPTKRLLQVVLSIVGCVLVAYIIYRFTTDWEAVANRATFVEFAAPIWLTLATIPFIYCMGAIATYESAFLRLDFASGGRKSRLTTKLALACVLKLNLGEVAGFVGRWPREASEGNTFSEATRVIRAYRASRREGEARRVEEAARLVRLAGVDGIDGDGHRLDQREFKETKDALHFLGTAQMGWYNNDGRYRADLLLVLESTFARIGLDEHGITMHVTQDGQKWWAWRRTITGWCFAIGASGPPPDQWLFDGMEPPRGYPREGSEWGSRFGLDAPNW